MAKCEHVRLADPSVQPSGDSCAKCLEIGQRWVQLRQCLICGHVGCCDSSPGQHANQHFKETGHPVMQAFQSGSGNGATNTKRMFEGPLFAVRFWPLAFSS